jgi:hypothetical protein
MALFIPWYMSVALNRVMVNMNIASNAGGSLETTNIKELDLEPRLSTLLNFRQLCSTSSSVAVPVFTHFWSSLVAARLLMSIWSEVGFMIRNQLSRLERARREEFVEGKGV